MWVFLILLALVPLFFFWTDAAVTLIPQWQSALPLAKNSTVIAGTDYTVAAQMDMARKEGKPVPWLETTSEKGYAAYLLSPDDQYRLVVGCKSDTAAILQVTRLTGVAMAPELVLDYEYGTLPITSGAYQGELLLGALAQMEKIVLKDGSGKALAQFNTSLKPSEAVARAISQACVR